MIFFGLRRWAVTIKRFKIVILNSNRIKMKFKFIESDLPNKGFM